MVYGALILTLSGMQEKFLFHPDVLLPTYNYNFSTPFSELSLPTKSGDTLNALYFKKPGNNALIVYYHGNAGSLNGWGDIAPLYLNAGFDFLIYDYQGFGKSTGKIENQEEFLEDAQTIYDYALAQRPESEITIIGYSIGSGPASYITSTNNPKQLILKAPYFSLLKLAQDHTPWLPVKWVMKYPMRSYQFLSTVKIPVTIFHGDKDNVIPVKHGRMLRDSLGENVTYHEIPGFLHGGMNEDPTFISFIQNLDPTKGL